VTQITDHLGKIRVRVADAAARAGRGEDDVLVLAVSKMQPAESIREAFAAGQRHFGESYVQEAVAKMKQLGDLPIEWHFIGTLQSNKTRPVAEHFAWVHTLDRGKLATRLNAHRSPHAPPLNVLIQVNQAGERQKGGVGEADVEALARMVMALPRLALKGLMCIPPAAAEPGEFFERLRDLRTRLTTSGLPLDMLSMGMSADFETAIAMGSNCVRIGTGIFGPRPA
jgi:pyridoxal phosphate enzyme (YggS family)